MVVSGRAGGSRTRLAARTFLPGWKGAGGPDNVAGPPSPWTLLDSREVYRRRLMRLREDVCRHRASGVEHRFFVLEFLDWVNVVPVTPEGEVVLVRQYRAGTGSWTLEIPGGTLDPGEDPAAAARRELQEETGYGEGEWTLLGTAAPNPAIQNNRCHLYLARDVRRLADPAPEPGEDLEVVRVGLEEVRAMAEGGSFDHALGALGLMLAMGRLEKEKSPDPGGDGRPACLPHHGRRMEPRPVALGQSHPGAQPVEAAGWDDLNPLEFERLRQAIRRNHGDQTLLGLSDRDLARALNLVACAAGEYRPSLAGLLLVGRDESLARLVPAHEVAWQVLDAGLRVRANEFYRWPLLRVVEEVLVRFRALNLEDELQLGMYRVPIPAYSEAAFSEAVANALVHRDYGRLGAVHIQWHPDRIEISNPGGPVEGVRLDNLLVAPPRARNRDLAEAFKRVGPVERTGRGIDHIFEGQLRLGRPAPDYSRTSENSVIVVLPGGPTSLAFARFVHERDHAGKPLSLDDLLVLSELQHAGRIEVSQVALLIQRDEGDARRVLNRLCAAGLIEPRAQERGGTYKLSALVREALGPEAAHTGGRRGTGTRAGSARGSRCHLPDSQSTSK